MPECFDGDIGEARCCGARFAQRFRLEGTELPDLVALVKDGGGLTEEGEAAAIFGFASEFDA